ncbi:hypothetical protein [Rhizobium glycinendophyticum]|uniref:Uncharacterized protein n=1 Tax=Rhizobium glycinendophyticum TaxID=2589807 RepID=A0A504UWS3_9HYPH|nr:hypothetical protein [Rhizobium glycinendophyticum]TPP09523.1 hypothetical protein FJQ55_01205 [Rhizobium glycinendophyticum]
MTTLARRTLLVSGTAALALAILAPLGAVAPASLSSLLNQEALARGGSDDGGGDSGGDDSGGGSSHDDSHDSSDNSSDDDGPDHDAGDDNGDDGAEDDGDDDTGKGRGGNRDEIRLIVNQAQLQGLVNGTMIPVDQNGVRLAFEIEQEHGKTEIKLRAPKGTLTGVTVIPTP